MQRKKRVQFFAVYPKGFFLIPFFYFMLVLQPVYGAQQLVPLGKVVGITLDTEGLLVLGTGSVEGEKNQMAMPCKGVLQAGDCILEVNGKSMENKEMLMEVVEESNGAPVTLRLERQGKVREVSIKPVFSMLDGTYKIGAWVRDSIQGIGTVTYYDPETGKVAALGHGVYDVDTDVLMEIREGTLVAADLKEIVRGQDGKAGKLAGDLLLEEKIAIVERNTENGIFGNYDKEMFEAKLLPTADSSEVKKGEAVILSDLEGGDVKPYCIKIETIQRNSGKAHKDMTIRITDERLLQLTGGIVQGMSGSPIIQDGKLVGAVTHVLVNDPTRGYGIFIENMLDAAG